MLYNRTICESLDRQRYQKNNRITRQEDLHVNYDYDPACILPNHVWFKPRIGIWYAYLEPTPTKGVPAKDIHPHIHIICPYTSCNCTWLGHFFLLLTFIIHVSVQVLYHWGQLIHLAEIWCKVSSAMSRLMESFNQGNFVLLPHHSLSMRITSSIFKSETTLQIHILLSCWKFARRNGKNIPSKCSW